MICTEAEGNLILVRGLPGSGKSTYVKNNYSEFKHFEADMYFTKNGVYTFDPYKIKDAHDWCFTEVTKNLINGENVAVSNTFTQFWEIQRYYDFCIDNGISMTVIEIYTQFKNIHNVPTVAIQRMKERWEKVNWDNLDVHCIKVM